MDMIFRLKLLFLSILFFSSSFPLFSQPTDTLTVGYNIVPPFVMERNGELSGPSVWLWENIASENGLVYRYRFCPLDSLLRGLRNGSIDLSLSPLTITSERARSIDFTAPYYIAHASLIQKDLSSFQKALKFIRSFLSVAFFQALGALALVIMIFGFLTWIFERKHNKEEFGRGIKGLWSGFWWSAVTMTTVGYGDKSPRTVGGRIVALVWMFTAIIIISSFTASIASALTISNIGDSYDDIQDYKERLLGTVKASATDEWLKKNFFTEKKTYPNIQATFQALKAGEIEAIAYDRPILVDLLKQDSLQTYRLLPLKYNPQFYATGLNRALPDSVRDLINLSTLSQIEKTDWKVQLSEYDLN